MVSLDDRLARRAARIAGQCHPCGADAIYVAAAEARDAMLITGDTEGLERGPGAVPLLTPVYWRQQGQTHQP